MSHNNTASSSFPSKGNPYEALALSNFATPSEIKKKFRQQSLKYHPDKRQQNLSQSQNDELDKQFIAVQEARDFLLNDDHRNEKEKGLKSRIVPRVASGLGNHAASQKFLRMMRSIEYQEAHTSADLCSLP